MSAPRATYTFIQRRFPTPGGSGRPWSSSSGSRSASSPGSRPTCGCPGLLSWALSTRHSTASALGGAGAAAGWQRT
eukprot:3060417-Alexandrium_andersonii.AAC.1